MPHFDEHGNDTWLCQKCDRVFQSHVKPVWLDGNVCKDCVETVEVTCRVCRRTAAFAVASVDLKSWREGVLIQNAMPYLSADQRELLISRTCGECFDKLFEEQP